MSVSKTHALLCLDLRLRFRSLTHKHCCGSFLSTGDEDNELSGAHNDVLNMKRYIQVRGFEEENIVILMDDGKHTNPTKKNIIHACKKVIREAEENDAILFLYSGEYIKVTLSCLLWYSVLRSTTVVLIV